jgi:preprotein translocase subunit SecE
MLAERTGMSQATQIVLAVVAIFGLLVVALIANAALA